MSVAEAPLRELLEAAPGPAPKRTWAPRPSGDLALTLGVGAATITAVFPITRLIAPSWLLAATLVTALVLLTGWALRRSSLPAGIAVAGEALAWVVCSTVALGHEDALLGILPTVGVVQDLPRLFGIVGTEIVEGVAPVTPSHEFWFVLVAATGLLALLVGLVVRAAHLPLLGAAILIIVFTIPQLAVPGDPDLVGAVILTAAILWIVRTEIRVRRPGMEMGPVASTWATVMGVGSIVVALILTPLVPLSDAVGGGIGRTSSITASLDLGDDLRRPEDVEVLRVHTDAPRAPYLRVATLTRFDGRQWAPDGTTRGSLDFASVESTAPVEERTTSIEITRLTSEYLPVPYPATKVAGATGAWSANRLNRTVVGSSGTNSLGQRYLVTSQEMQPTREQAREVMPRGGGDIPFSFSVRGVPEITNEALTLPEVDTVAGIRAAALEAIGEAGNAYDALVALQSWFRTDGDFEYSLEAPVEEGFDGSGIEAISRFLEVRSGYCVHFASTFAVMARSLGIPARVVVGYLPGEDTGEDIDDQSVYTVLGSQLHAWPEAYLEGIGWVPFDPTKSLGRPTLLSSAADSAGAPTDGPDATAAPTPVPTRTALEDRGDIDNPTGAARGFDPTVLLRTLAIVLGALVLLSIPAVLRAVRWRSRLVAASRGHAVAAWRELQDLVIDAGSAVDESESPRVFAARLTRERGVPAAALDVLVAAIERASFAPPSTDAGPDLARSLRTVRRVLLPAGRDRLRASLMPRSLLIRPRVVER